MTTHSTEVCVYGIQTFLLLLTCAVLYWNT